jgi:DNA-binding beta-propeller fold protein YncE
MPRRHLAVIFALIGAWFFIARAPSSEALGASTRWTAPSGHASASGSVLWVALGDSDELVEVDPVTFTAGRRIKTDPRPHGIAASADGSLLYVASDRTGNFQVLDALRGSVIGQIHVGNDLNLIALTADGRFAYVAVRADHQVAVVQLQPLAVVKRIEVPRRPHNLYRSSDGTRIYVGAQEGDAIAVLDPASQSLLHTIPTADGVRPMALSRDGKTIYAALSNLIGFVIVDPARRAVTRRIELARRLDSGPPPYLETHSHGLQLTADERELWVTDAVNDMVRIVSLSDMEEVAQIRVGHLPHWFALREDGTVMFLSAYLSDTVSAIDVKSRKVLANVSFARGSGPKRILLASRHPRSN